MNIKSFIDDVLSEVCLDNRIKDGIFDITHRDHINILREYLTEKVDSEFANELLSNLNSNLNEEGNYPERQAYNKDGRLITFPDAESKKAAIERGSHFENDPTGGEDEEDAPEEEDEEPSEPESIFTDFDRGVEGEKESDVESHAKDAGFDLDNIEIKSKPETDDDKTKGVHHVYDVLTKMQQKLADPEISASEALLDWDKLHPSILFALKQKWQFDKGGNWYDEFNNFRASTDRRGILDPAKSKDKEEMLLWIEDYLKRKQIEDTV